MWKVRVARKRFFLAELSILTPTPFEIFDLNNNVDKIIANLSLQNTLSSIDQVQNSRRH